jgi:hypothetical protein
MADVEIRRAACGPAADSSRSVSFQVFLSVNTMVFGCPGFLAGCLARRITRYGEGRFACPANRTHLLSRGVSQ